MSRAPKVCKDEVENFFKDRGHEVPLELWTTEDKNDATFILTSALWSVGIVLGRRA